MFMFINLLWNFFYTRLKTADRTGFESEQIGKTFCTCTEANCVRSGAATVIRRAVPGRASSSPAGRSRTSVFANGALLLRCSTRTSTASGTVGKNPNISAETKKTENKITIIKKKKKRASKENDAATGPRGGDREIIF